MASHLQPQSAETNTMNLFSMRQHLHRSIRNQTSVSFTLLAHLLSNKFNKSNVLFSPVSLHVVLSLTAAGSKGQTLDQILGFLKANGIDELNSLYSQLMSVIFADGSPIGGPQLSFANGLWVEKTLSFKPSFEHMADTVYKAACNQADFQNNPVEVVKEVNMWVEKHTNGLIKKALPADAVNSLTRLIFANAIYFKGLWRHQFDRSKTKEFDFHLLDGSKVKVPFMTSKSDQRVKVNDGFKVLGLPYIYGEDARAFTMYLLLPDAKDGLQSLVEKIGSKSNFLDGQMPEQWPKPIGQLSIPKFKISFGFEASHMLKELGLVLPFSVKDGLTEIVESSVGENLYVSKIHQKSFVEVNEQGTELAVSMLEMPLGASATKQIPEKVDFVADHPFLFMIREDMTGIVLFMGQVIDPSVD